MPPRRRTGRPENWKELLHACETARANGRLFGFIGSGIAACVDNAESLAADLVLLLEHNRNAAAQFIYATCMEEMGKAFILLDMVRADCRQDGRLKLLSSAFYSHLHKYGYARTVYFPGTGWIGDALQLYRLELIEYWPNRDPEGGEPDMVADGFAHRESAIYVDWVEYDGRWFSPPDSSFANFFAERNSAGMTPAREQIEELLRPLVQSKSEGLFSGELLQIIHEEFSPHYISSTSAGDIQQILAKLERRFVVAGSSVTSQSLAANFMRYPLYDAIFDQRPNHA